MKKFSKSAGAEINQTFWEQLRTALLAGGERVDTQSEVGSVGEAADGPLDPELKESVPLSQLSNYRRRPQLSNAAILPSQALQYQPRGVQHVKDW